MAWRVEFDKRAAREFDRLDPPVKKRIGAFLRNRIATASDPRLVGNVKALSGEFAGCFRWRVSDYRIIARVRGEDSTLEVEPADLRAVTGQRGPLSPPFSPTPRMLASDVSVSRLSERGPRSGRGCRADNLPGHPLVQCSPSLCMLKLYGREDSSPVR